MTRSHRLALLQRRSGQVLVLFCAGLFLLALSVMVSLALSSRVKERMELQTLADVSAYSNSVATARAFNGMAVMNRAMIGQVIAQSGTLALISWSFVYRKAVHEELEAMYVMADYYGNRCGTSCFWHPLDCPFNPGNCAAAADFDLVFIPRMHEEQVLKDVEWLVLEDAAQLEVMARGWAASETYSAQQDLLDNGLIGDKLDHQAMARRIANEAQYQSRWSDISAPAASSSISTQAAKGGSGCLGSGAACSSNVVIPPLHMGEAVEGSMGWPFVVSRNDPLSLLFRKIRKNVSFTVLDYVLPPYEIPPLWPVLGAFSLIPVMTGPTGGLGFGNGMDVNDIEDGGTYLSVTKHPLWFLPVIPLGIWSDDKETVSYHAYCTRLQLSAVAGHIGSPAPPFCGILGPLDGNIVQTNASNTELMGTTLPIPPHHFALPDAQSYTPPIYEFTTIPHFVTTVPALYAFPWFMDYNLVNVSDESENFGQPKNIAVLQRDYNLRNTPGNRDPWSIPFFYSQGTSAGQRLDTTGIQLADGTDISHPTTVATGITYYHRRGHWSEPPNLLNPYWRATLVSADVDNGGKGVPGSTPMDASNMVRNASFGAGADSIDQLRASGFLGIH